MRKIFTLAFAALFFIALQSVATSAQEVPAEIQSYVSKQGGAKKYPTEINKIAMGDLNGDGTEDAVVQYNVNEGAPGNYFSSYIAAFVNKGGKYVLAAKMSSGTKLSGAIVPSGIAGGKVAADQYPPNSNEKSGTVYYKLVGKKLVKTK